MPDESPAAPGDYPPSMRVLALFGLFLVGAVAFILIDVASNGRLTACADCGEEADSA